VRRARRGSAAVRLGAAALLGTAALAAPEALAHGRSVSYSSWRFDGAGARVVARVELLELSRLPWFAVAPDASDPRVGDYFAARLRLSTPDGVCEVAEGPVALAAQPGWSAHEWRVACPAGVRTLESAVLVDVAPSHLHFARVRGPEGEIRERVLSGREPAWEPFAAAASGEGAGTDLAGYVWLGVEHIVSGVDHLAFLLALILLATSLRELAMLVTGFTVAHSVTLALAALGVLRPDPAAVEALIGFSVALVCAENAWLLGGRGRLVPVLLTLVLLALAGLAARGVGVLAPSVLLGLALFSACHFGLLARVARPAPLRALVAFAFGLVHGFGFAAILGELELPRERLVAALFGFNAGVELGQLVIVLAVWPVLHALARLRGGRVRATLAELGSAAVCTLGVFWFVSRAYGS
jgi:hypothetical protein